jgi:hypothetical protein
MSYQSVLPLFASIASKISKYSLSLSAALEGGGDLLLGIT